MLDVRSGTVVVDVGGVGFAVEVTGTQALASARGSEVFFHTMLVVREDSLTLFGFATRDELDVFSILLGVSGVGPRSALGVLSVLSPDEIVAAVIAEDDKPFRSVSGIGPKTAKLITVSLAGKLDSLAAEAVAGATGRVTVSTGSASVQAALVGLGWSERDAEAAVAQITTPADRLLSDQELLRTALALLGSGGVVR
ncbi:Holliday junction DNA helicase subunit RuvA [Klugiella xanthotipulae]|uniref:Holliday junction branch migration complex subunit RuvA n=1 Tax=Klugiella xanthotipulae TaxID=244735 RepID=A0A543HS82_9MICO|nr:Holliday junction DNA helicase subunit RuvA [Klugiella xanthotipulae]